MSLPERVEEWFTQRRGFLSAAARMLQWQLLAFPILVMVTANLAFLFGGSCMRWQWWAPFAFTCVLPFLRGREARRSAALSCLCFIGFMVFVLLQTVSQIDPFWGDNVSYHMPAMRMLALGWNPIAHSTPESACALFGIAPWDMKMYQVFFMHKGAWVFNAVACRVHGDALSLVMPAYCYACAGAIAVVLRNARALSVPYRLLLAVVLLPVVGTLPAADASIAIVGFALLVAMCESLRTGRHDVSALTCCTLWLVALKASGLTAAAAFWPVFSAAALIRHRRDVKRQLAGLSLCGAVIALGTALLCLTPYFTSWRDYGHPAYPLKSADADRHPPVEMLADFVLTANDDLKSMSAAELFLNAFVSPSFVAKCRERRTGKAFRPSCRVWKNHARQKAKTENCPTSLRERASLWFAVLMLALLPGHRILPVATLLGLAAAPPYLYGFMRYFGWCDCLFAFSAVKLLHAVVGRFRFPGRLVLLLAMSWILFLACTFPLVFTRGVDRKAALLRSVEKDFYCNPARLFKNGRLSDARPKSEAEAVDAIMGKFSRKSVNNYILLSRMSCHFAHIKVHPLKSGKIKNYSRCVLLGCYFRKGWRMEKTDYEKRMAGKSMFLRALAYPSYMFHVLYERLPALLCPTEQASSADAPRAGS